MKKTAWKINHERKAPDGFYYIFRHWIFNNKPNLTENLLINISDYYKLKEKDCSPVLNPYKNRI